MGFFTKFSSVAAPTRIRASATETMSQAFWAGEPVAWFDQLVSSGMTITPELALTLSAFYGGVTTIAYDLSTLPFQVFKNRDDGGKDRVRAGRNAIGTGGIGNLVYMLRYQPNAFQTWTEFALAMVAQFLMREVAYAEIVSGPSGFLEQLLPRHPDRVTPERLPSGRLRYKLTETTGPPRYLTQEEMHAFRGLSFDGGLTAASRVRYGAQAIATALAAEMAAGKFFRSGMTAAKVATYQGQMDAEQEQDLHASITRFATGVENSFGLMLVPDMVKIENLAIEPEKAQMMLAREWGVREVARYLRLPGSKLGIKDAVSYNSQMQDAIVYVINTLRPIAVIWEQAIQRDLILAKDTYFAEFKLEALLRGDPAAQAAYITSLIKARVMRPSEARLILNMNPDAALDKLSEQDFRPGSTATTGGGQHATGGGSTARALLRGHLAVHDNAVRCLRRERAALEKLAKRHASDVDGWKAGLRDFYADHAGFVAETMRIAIGIARGYAAQHGSEFEAKGVILIEGDAGAEWERFEATELAELALTEGNTIDDWFNRRMVDARHSAQTQITTPVTVHVDSPVTIDKGAVAVEIDARTSVQPPKIEVDARTTVAPAKVEVHPSDVIIQKGAVHVEPPSLVLGNIPTGKKRTEVTRDPDSDLITGITETTSATSATPIVVRVPKRTVTKTITRDPATGDIAAITERED